MILYNKFLAIAKVVFLLTYFHSLSAFGANLPESNINNIWYEYNESDTVFVFVHGIFSDSKSAWAFQDENDASKDQYWPELVYNDYIFSKPAIFLGGFYTEIDSGSYNIRDASKELYSSLLVSSNSVQKSVMDKKNIVFIAHSTGGIVVRNLLIDHAIEFKDKTVGLVLMASPSVGSKDADRFNWLADIAKQKMGKELQWNHPFLEDLHRRFKEFHEQKTIPHLVGIEGVENHFIIKWLVFFNKEVLVEDSSAGLYFGDHTRVPNTDHFSIVKPNNISHPSHKLLRLFYKNKFLPELMKPRKETKKNIILIDTFAEHKAYDPGDQNDGISNSDHLERLIKQDTELKPKVNTEVTIVSITGNIDIQKIVEDSPDLLVIHRSAFFRQNSSRELMDGKIELFVSKLAGIEPKILIYSRTPGTCKLTKNIKSNINYPETISCFQFKAGNPFQEDPLKMRELITKIKMILKK